MSSRLDEILGEYITPEGQYNVNKEVQEKLDAEEEAFRAVKKSAAREVLARSKGKKLPPPSAHTMAKDAMRRILHNKARGRIASGGNVNVRDDGWGGWTDFQDVTISVPSIMEPLWRPTFSEQLLTAWGILEHELGHQHYTVPFGQYVSNATYFRTWNLLEDQHMENQVVGNNGMLRGPIMSMIHNVFLTGSEGYWWLFFAGRKYLPDTIRRMAYDKFVAKIDSSGAFHAAGTQLADEWLDIVNQYITAIDLDHRADAIHNAWVYLNCLGFTPPDEGPSVHSPGENVKSSDTTVEVVPQAPADKPAEPEKSEGEGGDEGDQEGEGGDELSKAMKDAIANERTAGGGVLDKVVDDMMGKGKGVNKGTGANAPKPTTQYGYVSMSKVARMADTIEEGLREFTTKALPRMQRRQETGAIDVAAYRTHRPGELDYRRHMVGLDNEGLSTHITLLLDNSGSMGDDMRGLAEASAAIDIAATKLGITVNGVLWGTGFCEYDTTQHTNVYDCPGATQPRPALEALDDTDLNGAKHHLVMILTDGAWTADNNDLGIYHREGRTIIMVQLKGRKDRQQFGMDGAVYINKAEELAYALYNELGSLLAEAYA